VPPYLYIRPREEERAFSLKMRLLPGRRRGEAAVTSGPGRRRGPAVLCRLAASGRALKLCAVPPREEDRRAPLVPYGSGRRRSRQVLWLEAMLPKKKRRHKGGGNVSPCCKDLGRRMRPR
jgi:hypothetical protein